ncbi:MAG: hypothetical protein ACI901_001894, partial [Octadecabacter sp.]
MNTRSGKFSVLKTAKLLQRHVLGGGEGGKRTFGALSV